MKQKLDLAKPTADLIENWSRMQHEAWDQYLKLGQQMPDWTRFQSAMTAPFTFYNQLLDQVLKFQSGAIREDQSLPKLYQDWLRGSESLFESLTETQQKFARDMQRMLGDELKSETGSAETSAINTLKYWRDASDNLMSIQTQWWRSFSDSLDRSRPQAGGGGRSSRRKSEATDEE